MEHSCLVLDRVSAVFGALKAVDDVSLSVGPGERHAIIGPNGAGKTTLFNLISGEIQTTGGTIVLFGVDVTGLPPHRRAARGIARTFQITRLFPNLTVLENLLLACEALDRVKFAMHKPVSSCPTLVQRAENLLADFGLSQLRHELARHLAYGDQRRLEVALSMAGLSAPESQSMQALLRKLDPAIAVLLIEHDMDIAFGFAEKITVLYQGRVLTQGDKDEVSGNRTVQEIYLGVHAD